MQHDAHQIEARNTFIDLRMRTCSTCQSLPCVGVHAPGQFAVARCASASVASLHAHCEQQLLFTCCDAPCRTCDAKITLLEAGRELDKVWLHVDMDAFYARCAQIVEIGMHIWATMCASSSSNSLRKARSCRLRFCCDMHSSWCWCWCGCLCAVFFSVEELDQPGLKDKPMAVGGMGMICTANYLARQFGVRSAMPGFIARKLCPQVCRRTWPLEQLCRAAAALSIG